MNSYYSNSTYIQAFTITSIFMFTPEIFRKASSLIRVVTCEFNGSLKPCIRNGRVKGEFSAFVELNLKYNSTNFIG
jgi:hypothetical protein